MDINHHLLWAKTDTLGNYHRLGYHLIDVGEVAGALALRLPPSLRDWFQKKLGVDDLLPPLQFFAASHDVGKANAAFQCKAPTQLKRLKDLGVLQARVEEHMPHGAYSGHALRAYFKQIGWQSRAAESLARVIGGHHGTFLSADIGSEDQSWRIARSTLLKMLVGLYLESDLKQPMIDNAFLMTLAGFISVADWIGSNVNYFPLCHEDIHEALYKQKAAEAAQKALDGIHWEPYLQHPAIASKAILKGRTPRDLQQKALSLHTKSPRLVIIEAPTGEGKTEAALILAEHFRESLGQRGAYFALPTMATSNAMFDRVLAFLSEFGENIEFRLLHGRALFEEHMDLISEIANGCWPVATEWFAGPKRGLLSPYAVGTIDQALLAVLKCKHGFIRMFGLAGRTLVIDELHAYDHYMVELIESLLDYISKQGGTCIILSATLPQLMRNRMLRAFGATDIPDAEYPCLTWVDAQKGAGSVPIEVSPRKPIVFEHISGDLNVGLSNLKEKVDGGGCGAFIVNTVGRAQEAFQTVIDMSPDYPVFLFHSRFTYIDRSRIEKEVVDLFGPNGERPGRAIVIATQVIEQSLDLDFDHMVTDLAPVDLVLQRAGRLHRHDRGERGMPIMTILHPPVDPEGLPRYGVFEHIYDKTVLLRSTHALMRRAQIQPPEGVSEIVEEVYGEDVLLPESWFAEYELARAKSEQKWHDQRRQARGGLIEEAGGEGTVVNDSMVLNEDDPDYGSQIAARTRLEDLPSVELVIAFETEGGLSLDRSGELLLNGAHARQILEHAVRLTHPISKALAKELKPPVGAATNRTLSHVRVLPLIEDSMLFRDISFSYSNFKGLIVQN